MGKLKVFKIEGDGFYCNGAVVVAAEDALQAAELANKVKAAWNVTYKARRAVPIKNIVFTGNKPRVILHFESGE